MRHIVRYLLALALICGASRMAMAIPQPGSPAIQPANGYATITVDSTSPKHTITVTATNPNYGVFWVAIFPKDPSCSFSATKAPTGWAKHPESGAAVWRTNTGGQGNWLGLVSPAKSATGEFVATPSNGCTEAVYVIHVIDLRTGNTFWTYPGQGQPGCVPATVKLGESVSIPIASLVANFTDPAVIPVTFSGIGTPSCGSAVVMGPNVVYTPTNACVGQTVTIPYIVIDKNGNQLTSTICVTVRPQDTPGCKVTLEVAGDATTAISVLAAGETLVSVTSPTGAGGTAAISANGTTIDYTPAAGYEGYDEVVFVYKNAAGVNLTGKACITVLNGPPDTDDDCDYVANVVEAGQSITIDVLANDSDPNPGDTLTLVSVGSPDPLASGTVAIVAGKVVFTAAANASGPVTFTYTVTDGTDTATGQVCLTVRQSPPDRPECDSVLIFGPDRYLTYDMAVYLAANNFPVPIDAQVNVNNTNVYQTPNGVYEPGALQNAIDRFKLQHNGLLPCVIMFDPEYWGPNGQWSGLDAGDQTLLRNLIIGGVGLVYAEPTKTAVSPLGQLSSVLPVDPYTLSDHSVLYNIVPAAAGHPVLAGIPNTFSPLSSGQANSLTLLGAPVGVNYSNIEPLLYATSPLYPTGNTAFALDYLPLVPTATQPGGRVVVIGTDPHPRGIEPNQMSIEPEILQLYFNALVWAGWF